MHVNPVKRTKTQSKEEVTHIYCPIKTVLIMSTDPNPFESNMSAPTLFALRYFEMRAFFSGFPPDNQYRQAFFHRSKCYDRLPALHRSYNEGRD